MLWHFAGYDVGRPRGGICPGQASVLTIMPRRSASSITNMNNKTNLLKPLADRGPLIVTAAAAPVRVSSRRGRVVSLLLPH